MASLVDPKSGHYVTFSSGEGTRLTQVQSTENPSPDDLPPELLNFPYGLFRFTVAGLAPGAAAAVELRLHGEERVNTYYKYGPTPADSQPHWYEFLLESETGTDLGDGSGPLILHLIDGQRGDDDLTENGLVVEPGGPAVSEHRLYFAQFGEGDGQLFSQILLFNLDTQFDAETEIRLKGDEGGPLTVDLNRQVVNGELQTVIPPRRVRIFETDGEGELTVGSVTVASSRKLAGLILFGGTVGVAGVASSEELPHGFLAPVQTHLETGVNTGVAVMQPLDEAVTVEMLLADSEGEELARAEVVLQPMGHWARFVTEIAWDSPVDFSDLRGLLTVSADGVLTATIIQTRPGEFATFPVVPIPEP